MRGRSRSRRRGRSFVYVTLLYTVEMEPASCSCVRAIGVAAWESRDARGSEMPLEPILYMDMGLGIISIQSNVIRRQVIHPTRRARAVPLTTYPHSKVRQHLTLILHPLLETLHRVWGLGARARARARLALSRSPNLSHAHDTVQRAPAAPLPSPSSPSLPPPGHILANVPRFCAPTRSGATATALRQPAMRAPTTPAETMS